MKKVTYFLLLATLFSCSDGGYKDTLSKAVEQVWDIDCSCSVMLQIIQKSCDYGMDIDSPVLQESVDETIKKIKPTIDSLKLNVESLRKIDPEEPSFKDISLLYEKSQELVRQLENGDIGGLDTLVVFVEDKVESVREKYNIPNPHKKKE